MGGRKDDGSRTPKQHKKRPLSAVIEEFESDDPDLKDNNNTTNNNNNERKRADDTASRSSKAVENSRTCQSEDNVSEKPAKESSHIPVVNINVTSDAPKKPDWSPKLTRSAGQKFGRRQALIPNASPKISRRGSSGLMTRFSDVIDSDDASDMTLLRQTAERLHLSTRRQSVLQWRERFVECPEFPVLWNAGKGDVMGQNGDEDGRWTEERIQRINTALDWIKNELLEMRMQDQQLARQLLTIRSDLHQLKLARSCEEHQDMMDEVRSEMEELQELADVLDLPTPTITDSPLHHLGVTRMNLSSRRFSTC